MLNIFPTTTAHSFFPPSPLSFTRASLPATCTVIKLNTFMLFGCLRCAKMWSLFGQCLLKEKEESLSPSVCCSSPLPPPSMTFALYPGVFSDPFSLPLFVPASPEDRTRLCCLLLLFLFFYFFFFILFFFFAALIKPSTYIIKVKPFPFLFYFCGT